MMSAPTVYRLVLEPQSSFLTELQSDTIMGHIAWMAAYRNKNDVSDLVERCKNGTPPFLVSSGFPHDHLPVPVLSPLRHEEKDRLADSFYKDLSKQERLAMMQNHLKKIKKYKYLSIDKWSRLIEGLSSFDLINELLNVKKEEKLHDKVVVMRTAINRLTGTAAESMLYDHEEMYFASGSQLDIWFKFFDDSMIQNVTNWLEDLSIHGFGANASSGAGQFEIISFEKGDDLLPEAKEPNAFMSLSHFSPAAIDPVTGWYNYLVKRGKLGGQYAVGLGARAHVWKFPFIMFTPGAVFKTDGQGVRDYYGRLIENIHESHKSAVQFTYAFPLKIGLK